VNAITNVAEEVGELVLRLSSDTTSFVTGAVVAIVGGMDSG